MCFSSIMPPAMADILDIWAVDSQIAPDGAISVDFLLPTGIYIQLEVPREATISSIKQVCLQLEFPKTQPTFSVTQWKSYGKAERHLNFRPLHLRIFDMSYFVVYNHVYSPTLVFDPYVVAVLRLTLVMVICIVGVGVWEMEAGRGIPGHPWP